MKFLLMVALEPEWRHARQTSSAPRVSIFSQLHRNERYVAGTSAIKYPLTMVLAPERRLPGELAALRMQRLARQHFLPFHRSSYFRKQATTPVGPGQTLNY